MLSLAAAIHHFSLGYARLFRAPSMTHADIEEGDWPRVSVYIAAAGDETARGRCIEATLGADYPADRLEIVAVTDINDEAARDVVNAYTVRHPQRVAPFYRSALGQSMSDALNDALVGASADVVLVLPASATPDQALIKLMLAPFFDPEIGAVIGRTIAADPAVNLLARLGALDAAARQQVDQQGRAHREIVAPGSFELCALRRTALAQVDGPLVVWGMSDADLTHRLRRAGWRTLYQNRAECHVARPQGWHTHLQRSHEAAQATQRALLRHGLGLMRRGSLSHPARWHGAALLCVAILPWLAALAWIALAGLYFAGLESVPGGLFVVALVALVAALGSIAALFRMSAAAHLDEQRAELHLLPLVAIAFFADLVTSARTLLWPIRRRRRQATRSRRALALRHRTQASS